MDPEEKGTDWKKVERKPKEKSAKETAAASRIDGTSRASLNPPRTIVGLDPKVEAARRKAEREKRFNTGRKVAPPPPILAPREGPSGSSSDEEGSDSGDKSPKNEGGGERGKGDAKEASKANNNARESKKHSAALQDALKKIDTKALTEEVNKAKSAQGNDKWIRLIAERLNEKTAHVPVDSHFYTEHGFTWGYPLNAAPSSVVNMLDSLLSSNPANYLQAYLDWCISDAARNYIPHRKPYHGSQLVVQFLLKKFPSLVTEKNLSQRVEEIRSVQSRKEEMLWIMWAYGQTGLTSFADGLQVWYRLMFPLINSRAYSGFALAYLDHLLKNHKAHDYSKINRQQVFLNIFDGFFGTNSSNFTKHHKKQIAELYRILNEDLFKRGLKDSSKEYFPQFLMRLGLQQPQEYQQAACENLLQCLKQDRANLDFWLEKFPSSLRDSQVLLNYIADTDDEETRRVRRDKRFLQFVSQLEAYQPSKKAAAAGTAKQDAAQIKQALQKIRDKQRSEDRKKRCRRFVWLLLLLAAAVGGEIAYHGAKKSYAVSAYSVAKPYVVRGWKSAQPVLARTWADVVRPTLLWTWAQTGKVLQYLWAASLNLWDMLEKKLPVVYAFLMDLGTHCETLWQGVGKLAYRTMHKADSLLVGMPSLSEVYAKLAPTIEWGRAQLWSGWLAVEPYWDGLWTGSKAKKA